MAIIRITTGVDGQSHFEDIEPHMQPLGDKSEQAVIHQESGIVIRRFDADRSNDWHNAYHPRVLRPVIGSVSGRRCCRYRLHAFYHMMSFIHLPRRPFRKRPVLAS